MKCEDCIHFPVCCILDNPYNSDHSDGCKYKLLSTPKGKWITFKTNRLIMQCPECTAFLSRERTDIFKDEIGNVNYCPNCGARMESDYESNN